MMTAYVMKKDFCDVTLFGQLLRRFVAELLKRNCGQKVARLMLVVNDPPSKIGTFQVVFNYSLTEYNRIRIKHGDFRRDLFALNIMFFSKSLEKFR